MKKALFGVISALLLISCAEKENESVTAKYSFVVSNTSSKAIITDSENLKFVCESGDEIKIRIEVYDENSNNIYSDQTGLETKCNLIYNGNAWEMLKDGEKVNEIDVTGKAGASVRINYTFDNKPENDQSNWFSIERTKIIKLKSGNQSINLDLQDAKSIAE